MTFSNEPALDTVPASTISRAPALDGPVGIGGWMILPIIGLGGTILWTGYNLFAIVTEWEGIRAIILGSNATAAAMRVPVGLSTLFGLVTLAFAALCLYRIFTYSPKVPKTMTAFYITLIVVTFGELFLDKMIADTVGTSVDGSAFKDVARVLLGAAIWIPYFNRSRRVANTFRAREAEVDRKIGEVF